MTNTPPRTMPHQFSLVPALRQEIETLRQQNANLRAWAQEAYGWLDNRDGVVQQFPSFCAFMKRAPDSVKGTAE